MIGHGDVETRPDVSDRPIMAVVNATKDGYEEFISSDAKIKQLNASQNVSLNGSGTVDWKGGSFHGTLTDPDAKLGTPASGSYLDVDA